MGVIVTKEDEQSSKLNDRITADLREKAQATTKIMDPDLVEGSEYTKSMKKNWSFRLGLDRFSSASRDFALYYLQFIATAHPS